MDEISIPRVYLKDPQFWRSAHHRAYVSPTGTRPGVDDTTPPLVLEFWGGVAHNVPAPIYRAFAAAGIATTDRPRLPGRDD